MKNSVISRLKELLNSLHLHQKIMLSAGVLFFCSMLVILLYTCNSAAATLTQHTNEQLQNQLTMASSTVGNSLDDIMNLMITLSTTTDMEDYVTYYGTDEGKYLDSMNGTNEAMRVLLQANSIIDYAALIRLNDSGYLYCGEALVTRSARDVLLDNAEDATPFLDTRIRINLLTEYYKSPEINLFCNVYEKYSINGENPIAILVVGINTDHLSSYIAAQEIDINLHILTEDGMILCASDSELIGTEEPNFDQFMEESGTLELERQLISYQKSSETTLITCASLSRQQLVRDIQRTELVMAAVVVGSTLLAMTATAYLCKRYYEPMRDILFGMEQVTNGNLKTKLQPFQEQDFRQLSEGFNAMTGAISDLVETTLKNEKDLAESRLQALQNQIKPHFLYNTLECIHWQALAEGNQEISQLVMALSKYYRICLSKGQDIIPLSQELELTQNYLLIQNIRFDGLFSTEYSVDEHILEIPVPKITLQPLVENAIFHGIKPAKSGNHFIFIGAQLEGEDMILTVADNGIGMAQEQMDALNSTINMVVNDGSYGVKNVHQRIEMLYGKGYGLHYQSNLFGGVTVEVRLPRPEAPEPQEV